MKMQLIAASFAVLCLTMNAQAERVVGAVIQTASTAQSRYELGVGYSSTGLIPAKLMLYCKEFVDEPDWDGLIPKNSHPCGSVDLQIRMTSAGLSFYLMNYAQANPLTFRLHVDPEATSLREVIGHYTGAKVSAGLIAGGRTILLHNDDSGVWATAGQAVLPKSEGGPDDQGFELGIDLSMPWLEVYLVKPLDLKETLSSLKDNAKTQDANVDQTTKNEAG